MLRKRRDGIMDRAFIYCSTRLKVEYFPRFNQKSGIFRQFNHKCRTCFRSLDSIQLSDLSVEYFFVGPAMFGRALGLIEHLLRICKIESYSIFLTT